MKILSDYNTINIYIILSTTTHTNTSSTYVQRPCGERVITTWMPQSGIGALCAKYIQRGVQN